VLFNHLLLISQGTKENALKVMFRGESMNISSLVEQIIYIAWFWYIGRGEIVLMYLFPIGVQVP
jgi:hypothetical protein